MKANINTIKADLYNVFISGNANNRQLFKIYLMLAIPALSLLFSVAHFPQF